MLAMSMQSSLDAARRVQKIIPAPGSLPTGTGADKSKEVVADVERCTTHTKFNMAIRQLIGWTGQKAPIDKLGKDLVRGCFVMIRLYYSNGTLGILFE